MKLVFTKPDEGTTFYGDLLRYYWMTSGVFFSADSITCTYNSVYNFWDVTVKRGCLFHSSEGRGSITQQESLWQENIDKLQQIHGMDKYKMSDSYTWEPLTDKTYIDGQDLCNGKVFCPAVRFWFYVEEGE